MNDMKYGHVIIIARLTEKGYFWREAYSACSKKHASAATQAMFSFFSLVTQILSLKSLYICGLVSNMTGVLMSSERDNWLKISK